MKFKIFIVCMSSFVTSIGLADAGIVCGLTNGLQQPVAAGYSLSSVKPTQVENKDFLATLVAVPGGGIKFLIENKDKAQKAQNGNERAEARIVEGEMVAGSKFIVVDTERKLTEMLKCIVSK